MIDDQFIYDSKVLLCPDNETYMRFDVDVDIYANGWRIHSIKCVDTGKVMDLKELPLVDQQELSNKLHIRSRAYADEIYHNAQDAHEVPDECA